MSETRTWGVTRRMRPRRADTATLALFVCVVGCGAVRQFIAKVLLLQDDDRSSRSYRPGGRSGVGSMKVGYEPLLHARAVRQAATVMAIIDSTGEPRERMKPGDR